MSEMSLKLELSKQTIGTFLWVNDTVRDISEESNWHWAYLSRFPSSFKTCNDID